MISKLLNTKLWKCFIAVLIVFFTFVSLIVCKPVYAQNSAEAVDVAKQFLQNHASDYSLRPDLSDLILLRVASGLGADAVHFQQVYQNIPVYGNYVSVSVSKKGNRSPQVTSLYDGSISLSSATPKINSIEAITYAQMSLGGEVQLGGPITSKLVVYPSSNRSGKYRLYLLVWNVRISAIKPLGDWDIFIDATTGKIVDKFNVLVTDRGPTTVPSQVELITIPTSPPEDILLIVNKPLSISDRIKSVLNNFFQSIFNIFK